MSLIVIIESVYATSNDTNYVVYSADFFDEDSSRGFHLAYLFSHNGYSVNLIPRMYTTIANWNSYLQNGYTAYFSTHGTADSMKIHPDSFSSTSLYFTSADLTSNVDVEFVFLSACYSAAYSSFGENLCENVHLNGATLSMGYDSEVSVVKTDHFETIFYDKFVDDRMTSAGAISSAFTTYMTLYGNPSDVSQHLKLYGSNVDCF